MQGFVYYTTLTPDREQGGFVVTFPDFPEAITQGEDIQDALANASDCLEEAVANRMETGLSIPAPSQRKEEQYAVPLHVQMASKAALYIALQESGLTKAELARQLKCDEKEIRRLLDPRHPSKLTRIEAALSVMGRRLIIEVQKAT